MKRIGITGGIGSGKSTFSRFLEEQGAVLFDADRVATDVMENNPDVIQSLKKVLGEAAYLTDGSLNRPFISQAIFTDESKRESVGKIVHPVVQQRFVEIAEAAQKEGALMLIREAAIPGSGNKQATLDYSIVVVAPDSIRLERVMQRSGLTEDEVKVRMKAQPTFIEYVEHANEVVFNEGSMEDLKKKAVAFWDRMIAS